LPLSGVQPAFFGAIPVRTPGYRTDLSRAKFPNGYTVSMFINPTVEEGHVEIAVITPTGRFARKDAIRIIPISEFAPCFKKIAAR